MSSIPSNDASCMMQASDVSCDAMVGLAKDEAARNAATLGHQVVHPVCERFQQLADRAEEHGLQKPPTFARKMCFTKTDHFQEGPWSSQFAPIPYPNVRFDTWTRAKGK